MGPKLGNLAQMAAQYKNVLKMLQGMSNPMAMQQQFQQAIGNNPMYGQVMQLVQGAGGDAKKAFYDLAQQNGIDPQQVLNALM